MDQTMYQKMPIAGKSFLVSGFRNVYPTFTTEIRRRMEQKKALNILVTGEAGVSKSYTAIQIARHLDPKFDPDIQVVYDYSEYMSLLKNLPRFRAIVFDEPSWALSKREWYKELQQALVKTIESQRFLLKPLIIPVINQSLLDKTIRSYLIQYLVYMYDRGKGVVYHLHPSQWTDEIYHQRICQIDYGMMDSDKCNKESCLTCKDMQTCNLIRARYERKKDRVQSLRYEQGEVMAKEKESKELTIDQIVDKAYSLHSLFTDAEGKIDVRKLRVVLRDNGGVHIGLNKAYDVKVTLETRYIHEFSKQ